MNFKRVILSNFTKNPVSVLIGITFIDLWIDLGKNDIFTQWSLSILNIDCLSIYSGFLLFFSLDLEFPL